MYQNRSRGRRVKWISFGRWTGLRTGIGVRPRTDTTVLAFMRLFKINIKFNHRGYYVLYTQFALVCIPIARQRDIQLYTYCPTLYTVTTLYREYCTAILYIISDTRHTRLKRRVMALMAQTG